MKILLLSCLALILLSCGKTAIDVDESFVGFWKGSDETYAYIFRFEEDGKGRYAFNGSGGFGNSEGKVRIKDDALKIGWKSWKINEYPAVNSDNKFEMTIDGVLFIKID